MKGKWIHVLLASGVAMALLFTAACDDDDDDNNGGTGGGSTNGTPTGGDTGGNVTQSFTEITPSGLTATKVSGGGLQPAVYRLRCNAIAGAVSYTFTTSLGTSETTSGPLPGVRVTVPRSEFGKKIRYEVFASNHKDQHTRTARATFAEPLGITAPAVPFPGP